MIKLSNVLWIMCKEIESIELGDYAITITGCTGRKYILPRTDDYLAILQTAGLLPEYLKEA